MRQVRVEHPAELDHPVGKAPANPPGLVGGKPQREIHQRPALQCRRQRSRQMHDWLHQLAPHGVLLVPTEPLQDGHQSAADLACLQVSAEISEVRAQLLPHGRDGVVGQVRRPCVEVLPAGDVQAREDDRDEGARAHSPRVPLVLREVAQQRQGRFPKHRVGHGPEHIGDGLDCNLAHFALLGTGKGKKRREQSSRVLLTTHEVRHGPQLGSHLDEVFILIVRGFPDERQDLLPRPLRPEREGDVPDVTDGLKALRQQLRAQVVNQSLYLRHRRRRQHRFLLR
mmetsp:Transcript_9522/g.35641  ORF Transcript_9522/g.35641 Transcript_9522/m.35641 type:complete len:283 (+) Transcript_9522:2013-2861(+)